MTAEREVVLSAGAVGTPKLLLLSGVGPKEHLKEHEVSFPRKVQDMSNSTLGHHENLLIVTFP